VNLYQHRNRLAPNGHRCLCRPKTASGDQ
jgi:hypothetical protein